MRHIQNRYIQQIIKYAALLFSIMSCTVFLVGCLYMFAEIFYGNFTLFQIYFHLTAYETMDFEFRIVICLLFLLMIGIFYLWLLKHPSLWLQKYLPVRINTFLSEHKIFVSYMSSLIVSIIGFLMLLCETSITNVFKLDYIRNSVKESTIIDDNYIDPSYLNLINPEPRNLIIIFAESLEDTFFNEHIFGENLLPNIGQQKALSVKGFKTLSEANWTKSSMVAALCGLTSKLYLPSRELSSKSICISDVMKKADYNTYYLQGSSAKFLNTYEFLYKHGFQKIEDINTITADMTKVDDIYNINFIGKIIDDDILLDYFNTQIVKLDKQKQPFLAIVSTMNTHPYNGHLARRCNHKYNDMRDALLCYDNILSSFIERFKKYKFSRKTTLLILGDHLMMYSNINNLLDKAPHRETLNLILGNERIGLINKPYTQLDWAPTILELAGFKWTERQFGLGTSLLSNKLTLLQKYGNDLDELLQRRSKLYDTQIYPKIP